MTRARFAASAFLGSALMLAACGGGNDRDTSGAADLVLPEPAAGPVPEVDVSTAAATGSPLPEIAVRQINGEGGWVQLKNELPADRPLLVWFWAPH